jgi:hypothetical protein
MVLNIVPVPEQDLGPVLRDKQLAVRLGENDLASRLEHERVRRLAMGPAHILCVRLLSKTPYPASHIDNRLLPQSGSSNDQRP